MPAALISTPPSRPPPFSTPCPRFFESLSALGTARTRLDPAKLEAHTRFCTDQLAAAAQHIAAARREAGAMAEQREAAEKLRDLAGQRKQVEVGARQPNPVPCMPWGVWVLGSWGG